MDAAENYQAPASPLEALATRPPEIKRGPGRPPGSGTKPKPAAPAPAPQGAAPGADAAAEKPEEFDWGSLTDEEAADLIASAADIGLRALKLRPLDDADVLPIRKHAKPVVKRWAGEFFKQYMHELLIVAALWGPVTERIEERKRAAAQSQTTPTEPAPQPAPMGP